MFIYKSNVRFVKKLLNVFNARTSFKQTLDVESAFINVENRFKNVESAFKNVKSEFKNVKTVFKKRRESI